MQLKALCLLALLMSSYMIVISEGAYQVTLRIVGSANMEDLVPAWNMAFSSATTANTAVSTSFFAEPTPNAQGLFAGNSVDLAFVDVPLTVVQTDAIAIARKAAVAQAPVAVHAISITYNAVSLNLGNTYPLNLTADILAGIYLGRIINWNDSAISTINPNLHVSLPITPFAIDDYDGSTYIFTQFMNVANKATPFLPTYNLASVNTSVFESTDDMLAAVPTTPGCIAYIPLDDAPLNGLPSAAILANSAQQQFVQPSVATLAAAVAGFVPPAVGTAPWPQTAVTYQPSTAAAPAYPIAFLVYALFNLDQGSAGPNGAAVGSYLKFLQSPGAIAVATGLLYTPVNTAVNFVNTNTIGNMTYAAGVATTDYWPPTSPQNQPIAAPTAAPTFSTISSDAIQIIIIVFLVLLLVVVIAIDQWRGGFILKFNQTGRGIWA